MQVLYIDVRILFGEKILDIGVKTMQNGIRWH